MSPMQEIGTLLVQTLGSLYLLTVVLRFLLQLAKADFYNPVSQFIVKATNPLLIPLRKVIPGLMGLDIASLVLAVAVQYLVLQLCLVILGAGLINPLTMLIWSAIGVLALIASVYFWSLLIMVIASWVAPHSSNPVLILILQLVNPIMSLFRRFLPDMGGIDISPIFAFLALNVVQVLIRHLGDATGMGGVIAQLVTGL